MMSRLLRCMISSMTLLLLLGGVSRVGAAIIDFDNPSYLAGSLLQAGQPHTWNEFTTSTHKPTIITMPSGGQYQGGKAVGYLKTEAMNTGLIGGTPVNTYDYDNDTMQADFFFTSTGNGNLNMVVFGWKDMNSNGIYDVINGANGETSVQFGMASPAANSAPRFYIRDSQFGGDTGSLGALVNIDTWYRVTAHFNVPGNSVTITAWDLTNNVAVDTAAGGGNLTRTAGTVFQNGITPAGFTGTGIRVDITNFDPTNTIRVIDNIGGVIPEPAGASLLTLGALGLLAVRRRR